MSKHTQIAAKDLTMKSFITQARKVGGRVVQEEVHSGNQGEEEFLDTLMGDGPEGAVDESEIEEGRDTLMTENPAMASVGIHDLMDKAASDMDLGAELMEPKRTASVKRAGKLADDTGDTVNFRRIAGNNVELTSVEGEVVEILSSLEFDNLLDTNEYVVL